MEGGNSQRMDFKEYNVLSALGSRLKNTLLQGQDVGQLWYEEWLLVRSREGQILIKPQTASGKTLNTDFILEATQQYESRNKEAFLC